MACRFVAWRGKTSRRPQVVKDVKWLQDVPGVKDVKWLQKQKLQDLLAAVGSGLWPRPGTNRALKQITRATLHAGLWSLHLGFR